MSSAASSNTAQSRREIQALQRAWLRAGKIGAKGLVDEYQKAGTALARVNQLGADSYQSAREAIRTLIHLDAAQLREGLTETQHDGVQPIAGGLDTANAGLRRLVQSGGQYLEALKNHAAGVRIEFEQIRTLASAPLQDGRPLPTEDAWPRPQAPVLAAARPGEWPREGARIAADHDRSRTTRDADAPDVTLERAEARLDRLPGMTEANRLDAFAHPAPARAEAPPVGLSRIEARLDRLPDMIVPSRLGTLDPPFRPAPASRRNGEPDRETLPSDDGQVPNSGVVTASQLYGQFKDTAGSALQSLTQHLPESRRQALENGLQSARGTLINTPLGLPVSAAMAGGGKLLDNLQNYRVEDASKAAPGGQAVFVTNWPDDLGGGKEDALEQVGGQLSAAGGQYAVAGKLIEQAGHLKAAWDVGQTVGGFVSDKLLTGEGPLGSPLGARAGDLIGTSIAYSLAFLGNEEAQQSIASNKRLQQLQEAEARAEAEASPRTWANGMASRLPDGQPPLAGASGVGASEYEARLRQLLAQPLVIDVRTDSDMISAEVGRRTDIEVRRGQ